MFDLGDRQGGVLLVEPNRVIAALLADDIDDLRMTKLPDAEDAHELSLGEQFFQSFGHDGSRVDASRLFPWAILQDARSDDKRESGAKTRLAACRRRALGCGQRLNGSTITPNAGGAPCLKNVGR